MGDLFIFWSRFVWCKKLVFLLSFVPSIPTFLSLSLLPTVCVLISAEKYDLNQRLWNHVTISPHRMKATWIKKKTISNPSRNQRILVFSPNSICSCCIFFVVVFIIIMYQPNHISLSNAFSRTRASLKWKM